MKLLSLVLFCGIFLSSPELQTHEKASAEASTGTLVGTVTDAATNNGLHGATVEIVALNRRVTSSDDGSFEIRNVPAGSYLVRAAFIGFRSAEKKVTIASGVEKKVEFALRPAGRLSELALDAGGPPRGVAPTGQQVAKFSRGARRFPVDFNTENYSVINENTFRSVLEHPLSTFAIDVDAASYSNVRRFIRAGQKPPKDAVRIEELVNYFDYEYPQPEGEHPFSVTMEMSDAPWNVDNKLLHIGLQGKSIPREERPTNNLVFLLDVSGSMRTPAKLPLLKKGFEMLVQELRPDDRVAIVVYAGASGLVLQSTPGRDKERILSVLSRLRAGGTTAGAAGIKLAYQVARDNYVADGNNRVILATDGDFNVGVSSDAAMVRLIENNRDDGVFLTVLGFGTGNLKDSKMEGIADHGNGNYYYIDGLQEARKVLVQELGSTLFAIAKDVKLQVEFNPARVASYRLIGYENRLLNSEDFADDTKDAGELGAGHTVTALYELVPARAPDAQDTPPTTELKYQDRVINDAAQSDEMVTVKLRYKDPQGSTSKLLHRTFLQSDETGDESANFTFSAAVASFGMLLRGSEFKGEASLEKVLAWARAGQSHDRWNYRQSFIDMVETYRRLDEATQEVSARQ